MVKSASDKEKVFINSNISNNVSSLLLKGNKDKDIDIAFCVKQIEGKQIAKEKFPFLLEYENFIFPPHINLEQASSQITAQYKKRFFNEGAEVCDLSLGMGIDSIFFAHDVKKILAFDSDATLCEIAKHNFSVLHLPNIEVRCQDSTKALEQLHNIDIIYLDPSRRDSNLNRVINLQDCSPNLIELQESLLQKAPKVIAKLSPMLELSSLILLPHIKNIHILSIQNECKELICVMQRDFCGDISFHCVNFLSDNKKEEFDFISSESKNALPLFCNDKIESYLLMPNSSVMKAEVGNLVSQRYGIKRLSLKTNLYTSEKMIEGFCGRQFKVQEVLSPSKCTNKRLKKANIIARNYPMSVNQIRQKTKIKEGGEDFLFFTTINKNSKIAILARRAC